MLVFSSCSLCLHSLLHSCLDGSSESVLSGLSVAVAENRPVTSFYGKLRKDIYSQSRIRHQITRVEYKRQKIQYTKHKTKTGQRTVPSQIEKMFVGSLFIILFAQYISNVDSFTNIRSNGRVFSSKATPLDLKLQKFNHHDDNINNNLTSENHRRSFLQSLLVITAGNVPTITNAATSDTNFLSLIKEARQQLSPIPNLIKEEKWDSVRAILITPPLSDCWGTKSSNSLLKNYAEFVSTQDGDELTALELKEDALDHLRFLDMAVYNNVFNPIKSEGENGATKELIRSYYEDPVREYNTCVKIFDELISLVPN